MIYTVTLNPAIDYVLHTGEIVPGATNRSKSEEYYYGGKGINVSVVLKELGLSSCALGFIAGFTGDAIEAGVKAMGIETDFVKLKEGNSRINVKIKAAHSEKEKSIINETEINGRGPDIDSEALEKFYKKQEKLRPGDILVLSGSIPGSLSDDTYEKIMERVSATTGDNDSFDNIRVVVDAEGRLLLSVLKYRPFLVKPNKDELGALFGVKIESVDDAFIYAGRLRKMGAGNVLVSLGADGAILLDENGSRHYCKAPEGRLLNSVGAGDSMVAGFLAGLVLENDSLKNMETVICDEEKQSLKNCFSDSKEEATSGQDIDYENALRLGVAAGSATAFSPGLAVRETIEEMRKICIPAAWENALKKEPTMKIK